MLALFTHFQFKGPDFGPPPRLLSEEEVRQIEVELEQRIQTELDWANQRKVCGEWGKKDPLSRRRGEHCASAMKLVCVSKKKRGKNAHLAPRKAAHPPSLLL
jgi:hypothetical protein